jgi:Flp pilus assembly protein TadG
MKEHFVSSKTARLTFVVSDSESPADPAVRFVTSGFPRGSETGSTMVEFALVCVLFLTMLFGIIDFGRALYDYHFVSNAARDATRWATVNGSTCADDSSCNGTGGMNNGPVKKADVQTYVKNLAIAAGLNTNSTGCGGSACLTTTAVCGVSDASNCADSVPGTCTTTYDAPGCAVKVQVSYKFNFLSALVNKSSITLSSTSEMVIAH